MQQKLISLWSRLRPVLYLQTTVNLCPPVSQLLVGNSLCTDQQQQLRVGTISYSDSICSAQLMLSYLLS